MQEITIQYSNPKTLKFLKEVSKYFDFIISPPKPVDKKKETIVNGVTLVRSKGKIIQAEMEAIFTTNNIDAKELREKWQRK